MSGAVVLVGLSGSGKTTVGRLVAAALGVPFLDTDDAIAASAGKPVPQIFAEDGEEHFRDLETKVIVEQVALLGRCVIATGGGAVLRPANIAALTAGSFVVWLDAPADILAARLAGHAATPAERPLLRGGEAQDRLAAMAVTRGPTYASVAALRLDTTRLTAHEATAAIVAAAARWYTDSAAPGGGSQVFQAEPMRVFVPAAEQSYPVVAGWGVARELGRQLRAAGLEGRPFLFLDSALQPLYGEQLSQALSGGSDVPVASYAVPAGEEYKTLAEVARAYEWLAAQRAERRDILVAAGGGKAGDLVGFVAATYLRGMRLVQVPTTLLAQVDSSLGGKVGVDLPAGKNLVGAFHHPSLVVADLAFLRSLPRRELTAGYAEVIKHGLIGDAGLFSLLEDAAFGSAGVTLLDLPDSLTERIVRRAMAVKIDVVQDDVREAGRRAILNYGHSVGHALEVVTGYRTLLHGEAVALGMVVAAELSCRIGLLDRALARRQDSLLRAVGLLSPAHLASLSAIGDEDVIDALGYDKKMQAGRLRWVLLRGLGDPLVTADVPPMLVHDVVRDLLAGRIGAS